MIAVAAAVSTAACSSQRRSSNGTHDVRSGRERPVDFQIALSGFAHHPVRTRGVDTSSTTVRSSLNHTAA
jgi:hypothetical protein